MNSMRIGHGYDVHAFTKGRKLILGGIEIPSDLGLEGHSDADVLLHAVSDAILGALAWGDIGQWFPNSEEEFKGISSLILLDRIWEKVSAEGWTLANLDCTILAEVPKISPFSNKIRENIALHLGAKADLVSLKATTTERLGFVGREEGMVAMAVVLLNR